MAAVPPPAYPGQPQYGAPPPAYPQQGYYPQQPAPYAQQTNTVVLAAPAPVAVASVTNYGSSPTSTVCPHCRKQVVSRVDYEIGSMAWVACFVMWFVGLWCCCFIPFLINDCKDVVHYCPECNNHLGKYSRM